MVREEVIRGAEFLDVVRPGWEDGIDLDILRLSSCQRCVLGQLYGDFGDGIDKLIPLKDSTAQYAWATRHGFALHPATLETHYQQDYDSLTDDWRELISQRRNKFIESGKEEEKELVYA